MLRTRWNLHVCSNPQTILGELSNVWHNFDRIVTSQVPSDFAVDVVSLQALVKGGFVWGTTSLKMAIWCWKLLKFVEWNLGDFGVTYGDLFSEKLVEAFQILLTHTWIRWLGNGRVFLTPKDPHLKILLGGIFWEHSLVVKYLWTWSGSCKCSI